MTIPTINDILFGTMANWETLVSQHKIQEVFIHSVYYILIQHSINRVKSQHPEIDYSICTKTKLTVDGMPGWYCIMGTYEAEDMINERVEWLQDYYKD